MNKVKNLKYRDLMEKLKNAVEEEFYYEAIFIEYAVLEDRTESILRHALILEKNNNLTLSNKLFKITKANIFNDQYIKKHLTTDLIDSVYKWKNKRNILIHDLVNTSYDNEEIKDIALSGYDIVTNLNNKSTLVNKYLDKLFLD